MTRGGKRAGAGRPRDADASIAIVSLRLRREEVAVLDGARGDVDRATAAKDAMMRGLGAQEETNMTDDITDEDISKFRHAAWEVRDYDQAAICDRALAGDQAARTDCARAIAEGRTVDAEEQRLADLHCTCDTRPHLGTCATRA